VTDLLEAGDLIGVDMAIAAHTRLAAELRQRFHMWYSAIFRTMRALLSGELDDGEKLAQEALTIGQQARLPIAMMMFGLQMFLLRREQGRLEEMEPALKQFAEQSPAFIIARYMLAYCYAELGREAEARQVFTPLAARRFTDLSQDSNWLIGLNYATEVSHYTDNISSAAILYDLLRPYAERTLVVGRATVCYGSVSRILGLLATTMKRWEEAEAHFTTALQRHEYMVAKPLLARTQYDYGRMLLSRGQPSDHEKAATLLDQALAMAHELGMTGLVEKVQSSKRKAQRQPSLESRVQSLNSENQSLRHFNAQTLDPGRQILNTNSPTQPPSAFRCEGDYWTITYDGMVLRLKDTAGLRYLAQLLRHPEQEFHVLDLVRNAVGSGAEISSSAKAAAAELESPALGDAGEILDPQARTAYKQRVKELRAELVEAEEFHDLDRVERLREELEFLMQQLAKAVGLGGRDRKAASAAERARVNVTRAIKAAIKKSGEQCPALELYLATTIKTGLFCSYTPDPRIPVSWEF
jgi:tetratricopeptide (TPR) repeat protein